jgi:hypothetical protein
MNTAVEYCCEGYITADGEVVHHALTEKVYLSNHQALGCVRLPSPSTLTKRRISRPGSTPAWAGSLRWAAAISSSTWSSGSCPGARFGSPKSLPVPLIHPPTTSIAPSAIRFTRTILSLPGAANRRAAILGANGGTARTTNTRWLWWSRARTPTGWQISLPIPMRTTWKKRRYSDPPQSPAGGRAHRERHDRGRPDAAGEMGCG